MTIFSFHTMKNMSTLGEGGMITTDDGDIVPRLREMRQFGGEHWGSSYKMTRVQAAVGPVQLRRLDGFIAARRKLAEQRSELLAG
jgi:dTDP-4-amino-4,6-dideoxygalactose transaminase